MRTQKNDTAGKTENFFSRNVKLITFLVCMALFFAIAAAIGTAVYGQDDESVNEGKALTESHLIALAQKGSLLSIKDFRAFEGTEQKKTVPYTERIGNEIYEKTRSAGIYYYAYIRDEYLVLAVSEEGTGKIVYCTVTHIASGRQADVLTDDLTAFFTTTE